MQYIIVTPEYQKHIALIQLNRPKELNALNLELMGEIRDALKELDQNDAVRAIIITGNERAFAAGADIKQMAWRGRNTKTYKSNWQSQSNGNGIDWQFHFWRRSKSLWTGEQSSACRIIFRRSGEAC